MTELVRDPLYLACTRPAMKYGVPAEGYALNVGVTWIGGMVAGSPLYWSLGFVVHFLMRPLANKNPNFFREMRMWFDTKAANAGGSVWALSPHGPRRARDLPSCV
jgi:type IV secretion system protein VirB3